MEEEQQVLSSQLSLRVIINHFLRGVRALHQVKNMALCGSKVVLTEMLSAVELCLVKNLVLYEK